jgi:hypothetical protein
MLIVYINNGSGWEPITHMVNVAAELFEAEIIVLDSKTPKSIWVKLEMLLLKRDKRGSEETCLLICPDASSFLSITQIKGWRKRFRCLAVWIIDSFWLDRIPKAARLSRPFDHIFITSEEDVAAWTEAMQTPTTCLAWGSNVLGLGSIYLNREWDLARIGRQPPEWDDDENTKRLCTDLKLTFHGRVQSYDTAEKNQQALMRLYQQSKYLLAFSNSAHPNHYTHPTRQYITGRWTDALACGAIVAGIAPNEPSIKRLLWDGATLDLKSIKINEGLPIIAEAAKLWKPEQAIKNHLLALERLDWRWRFVEIAAVLKESPKRLSEEIKLLKHKITAANS